MLSSYRSTLRACYLGYISQAIICNLAPLFFVIFQSQFGISDEQTGRLILFNFGTQIFADVVATKYVDKIGYRISAVTAHIFCAVGIVALSILPRVMPNPYTGLLIAAVLYAMGGGLIEVLISPIVDSLPSDDKASTMSLLHSFYCWGQMAVVLLTTIALKIFGHGVWIAIPFFWALVPVMGGAMFTRVPLMPTIPEHEKTPLRRLFSTKIFVLAMIMMAAAGSSELTMSQWSSLFAEKGLGVSKIVGDLLGPCLFAIMMGTVRALYGVFGAKVKLNNALIVSGAMCVVCYILAVWVGHPFLSLLGCAFCGISVALMWPGTLSLTSARFPVGGTAMFGVLAICGDLGGAIGPWMAGFVSDVTQNAPWFQNLAVNLQIGADQLGLKAGLLISMIFPMLLLVGAIWMKRIKSEVSDKVG